MPHLCRTTLAHPCGIAGWLNRTAAWLQVLITRCVPWAPLEPADPYLPCPKQLLSPAVCGAEVGKSAGCSSL